MNSDRARLRRADLFSAYLALGRSVALRIAAATMLIIAAIDWIVEPNLAIGMLYVFPIMLAAPFLERWHILAVSASGSLLREAFAPFQWQSDSLWRLVTVFFVFLGAGWFAREFARNRQLVVDHLREIQEQVKLRQEAEEQLRALIESSPAAILTVDSEGRVLLANDAAHRLFGLAPGELAGHPLRPFLPLLADVILRRGEVEAYRTTMQCAGRRRDGEVFYAYTWFSTYGTDSGRRLAAIVVDASEDLRDREEQSLHQVLTSTRILVGAVSHEIRNLCGAITVVQANLARVPGLTDNEDFRALGSLATALSKLASAELRPVVQASITPVDLAGVFDELRVVAESSLGESDARIEWDLPQPLPPVWADRHGLLQVFLNLAQNSGRAMQESEDRCLTVTAAVNNGNVIVRFRDTGPGVAAPDRLFQPFQPGADVGLGLYVSRAIVRSFHGDLQWEPAPRGCCFAVRLEVARTEASPA